MSGRWRHPNRAREKAYSRRPRHYKANSKILRRVEENLDEYRQAARMVLDLVAKMDLEDVG